MTLSSLLPFLPLAAVVAVILGVKISAKIRAERRHDRAVSCACRTLEDLSGKVASPAASARLAALTELRDHYYEQGATAEEWQALSQEAETLAQRPHHQGVAND